MGTPCEFSQEWADTFCQKIAEGRSARSICAEEGQPAASSVFKWLGQNKDFAEQYARAREAQAEGLFEEILEIADDSSGDSTTNAKGDTVMDTEYVQRSKLRVDARKWYLSKLAPKKYGDKVEQEFTGGLEIKVTRADG